MATWRTTLVQTYRGSGGPGYSTLHFRHDGVESDLTSDLENAAEAFIEALSEMQQELTVDTTWAMSGVWQDVDGEREVVTARPQLSGPIVSGPVLPSATCLVLGWRTENRSRSGRGRTFLSGFPSGACVDGTPSGTLMTRSRAAVASLVAWNAGFANGSWAVYSPTSGLTRDITGGAVRDTFAVLRSRRD